MHRAPSQQSLILLQISMETRAYLRVWVDRHDCHDAWLLLFQNSASQEIQKCKSEFLLIHQWCCVCELLHKSNSHLIALWRPCHHTSTSWLPLLHLSAKFFLEHHLGFSRCLQVHNCSIWVLKQWYQYWYQCGRLKCSIISLSDRQCSFLHKIRRFDCC